MRWFDLNLPSVLRLHWAFLLRIRYGTTGKRLPRSFRLRQVRRFLLVFQSPAVRLLTCDL